MKCMSHLSHLPGYEVDNLGFNSQQGQQIFLSQTRSNWHRGPPLGTGVLSSGIKLAQHEADNLLSSSVEFKNEWSYTSALPA